MESYREGGSEKHLRDVASVIKITDEALDWQYLERWARELNLERVWKVVLERVEQ